MEGYLLLSQGNLLLKLVLIKKNENARLRNRIGGLWRSEILSLQLSGAFDIGFCCILLPVSLIQTCVCFITSYQYEFRFSNIVLLMLFVDAFL